MNDQWRLWKGQARLLEDTKRPELAIVAGWGYGKTTFGARWHFSRVLINDRSPLSLVVAADYKLAKQVNFEAYIITMQDLGLVEGKDFSLNIADLTITHNWGVRHKTIFLSAEKPRKIMAYTASHAWGDEAARWTVEALLNLIGRIRCPKAKALQAFYTTTPEGYNFFYERFSEDKLAREGRHSENDRQLVLHGASFDNKELPKSFIDNLKENFEWDEAYYNNWVLGEFFSMSRNGFYYSFNPKKNVAPQKLDRENRQLVLTFDFNVGQMTWAVIQEQEQHHRGIRKPVWSVLKANKSNARNIQEACQQFIDTYPPSEFKSYRIKVLGDSYGHNRSDQTYTTGYQVINTCLLPHYPGLTIEAKRSNPLVAERSFCTNRLFSQGRLMIDPGCTRTIESAKVCESDGKGGIVKPPGDTKTHPMEAVDMALMVLEPPEVLTTGSGYNRFS